MKRNLSMVNKTKIILRSRKIFLVLLLSIAAQTSITCSNRYESPQTSESKVTAKLPTTSHETVSLKRNVVLIVIDSLRYDHFVGHLQNQAYMPKLKNFASKCQVFENAYTQATWTKPAVISLFTSLYPEVHKTLFGVSVSLGVEGGATVDGVSQDIELMSEFFKKNGYATLAVQTNINLNEASGLSRGFDEYILRPYPMCRASEATQIAIDKIQDASTPYFLYIHYMDPHHPYNPPEPYHNVFASPPVLSDSDRTLLQNFSEGYYLDKVLFEVGLKEKRQLGDLSAEGRQYLKLMYDGEVRFTDDEVIRLIDTILDRTPNTNIIVTADHGEEFWDHGSIGHSKTVFEELSHVPLFFYIPGMDPGIVSAPVELIDILPTIAALLQLPVSETWQGQVILGPQQSLEAHRPVFTETRGSLRKANLFLRAVKKGQDKLIYNVTTGDKSLFVVDDSGIDRAAPENSDLQSALWDLLSSHMKSNASHPLFGNTPVENKISDQSVEQLRSIGYLN